MNKTIRCLVLAALAGCWAVTAPLAAAPGDNDVQADKTAAADFELQMRVLQGGREKPQTPVRPVTSSYLEFLSFANFEDEANAATDDQIKKVFNLTDVGLLTETTLAWDKGRPERASHMFRINGQEYLVLVTPGRLPERGRFRIEVQEQNEGKRSSLLDTEFLLPGKTAAVFGFEDSKGKAYFITLRLARGAGQPDVAAGSVAGVTKSGAKVKPPKLIKKVEPVYPEAARKSRLEGVVILEATADTYGRVAAIKVLRSIPSLDQAAVDALRQWVYEPMVVDGKPQEVTFTVTVQFALNKGKKVGGGVATGVSGGVAGGVEGAVKGGVQGGVGKPPDLEAFEKGAVRVVGGIEPPALVKEVKPDYPENARQARVEGLVILEAKIDERGRVIDARILRSIPLLDQAALEAVKQWRYEPLVVDGKPRQAVFTVTVRFALDGGEKAKSVEKFARGAVKAEGDIKPPMIVKEKMPVYPEAARSAGVQGVVILSVRTDEQGRVADVMVLRSIPLLDQAAIDAVKQWLFEPLVVDGKPTPAVFNLTVRFKLE